MKCTICIETNEFNNVKGILKKYDFQEQEYLGSKYYTITVNEIDISNLRQILKGNGYEIAIASARNFPFNKNNDFEQYFIINRK